MDRRWGYGTEQRLRDDNQDTHGVFQFRDFLLVVVADGMGGHHGGAHASAMAVRTVYDALKELEGTMPIQQALAEAIRRANQAIYDASRRSHRLMGMGTTVAAVAIGEEEAYVAHVGDSRVYLVRGGQAVQLTRDHTMVNLFVEAELLSPEDAASHPEAHVLSRSLGVERTVEVDVHEPIALEYADTFVLCTDGVHGVLTEWEFGNIDWSDPQEGVWEALRLVAAREGDDNATVVGVIVGEFDGLGRPPTPPPLIETVDDPMSPVSVSSGGGPPPVPIPNTPPPAPIAMPPTTLVAIPATPAPAPERHADSPPPQPGTAAPTNPREKKASGKDNRVALAAVGAVGALALLGSLGVVAIMGIQSMLADEPAVTPADGAAMAAVAVEAGAPPAEAAPAAATAAPVTSLPPNTLFSAAMIPPDPKRAPHRPKVYVQPPPGGGDQVEAITAARTRECAKSLGIIRNAMLASQDHASLYDLAWDCFKNGDQAKLTAAQAADPEAFAALVVHFEGPPPEKPDKSLPAWYRPPTGGIEYRLDAFLTSGDRDLFAEVMLDRKGEEVVADHLTRDVWLEAIAAAGLATIAEPTDEQIDWWARRVYYVARSMRGSVGEMVRRRRPDAVEPIDALFAAAVLGHHEDELLTTKKIDGLPEPVRKAWAVAVGVEAAPERKATGPAKPPSQPKVRKVQAPKESSQPSAPIVYTGK